MTPETQIPMLNEAWEAAKDYWDLSGRSALHYAAMGGSLKTAKALIRKNFALPEIQNKRGSVPLYLSFSSKQLVWYLILVTRDEHPCFPFTGPLSAQLVCKLICYGYYDIMLYLVGKYPELIFAKHEEQHLLGWLSMRYSNFLSGSNHTFWERWIYKLLKCLNRLQWKVIEKLAPLIKQVREEKLKHVYAVELVNHVCTTLLSICDTFKDTTYFFNNAESPNSQLMAASLGIDEIITTCVQYFPDLVFIGMTEDHHQLNLLQEAIANRQANIFYFIKEMPTITQILNFDVNFESETTLHLAAKLAPSSVQLLSVSGAALQMQRELQWFKAGTRSPQFKI
ncbi:hypothetical protein Dsin_016329 [Dipteronia sinensis]|uniref:Ankyrin repeat protein n=1 Tax=Dipteronia sinensis TaxID=43782 RepID=A0AAE0ADN9_9ROSI|nr:hypothetical protein Dsin_016329 [Dipteronia sinensis]